MLPVKRVLLEASPWSDATFTGIWKALEELAREQAGVADLVQLNGYYQYTPSLKARVLEAGDSLDAERRAVVAISEGRGVGKTMPLQDLAGLWGIQRMKSPARIFDRLRQLGFEARSTNTNPQIPESHYLVPYAFPTLTPHSVQLRKSV